MPRKSVDIPKIFFLILTASLSSLQSLLKSLPYWAWSDSGASTVKKLSR